MNIKKIAVIRNSAMGDVAISVPVLTAFREQYPDVKIVMVTKKAFAPMFSHLADIQIISPDFNGKHKGVLGLFRLYKELKKQQVDAVADIHNVLRTNVLRFFFFFSKIPFVQIDKGRKEKKALTRANHKIFKQLATSYKRYAAVFERLGFPLKMEKPHFVPKKNLSNEIKTLLSESKNIGFAPFASHQGKQYPFEELQKVITAIATKNPSWHIFIFGGGNNENDIVNSVKFPKNVKNVIGSFSMNYELELISNLDLMVAMDSGNAHLSAMFGVKTITIWGVTHPFAGFYPYFQPESNAILANRDEFPLIPTSIYGNKYPKGYENAIKTIKFEEILRKIEEKLG